MKKKNFDICIDDFRVQNPHQDGRAVLFKIFKPNYLRKFTNK